MRIEIERLTEAGEDFERVYAPDDLSLEDEHTRHPNDPAQELTGLAWQTLSGYFESHPLSSERIQQVRTMINDSSDPRWHKTNEMPVPAAVITAQAR